DLARLAERPWTRHYDPGGPATLGYRRVPLHAKLDDAAESDPSATATILFNRKHRYKSIHDAAWRFADGLRRLGIKHGDSVALVLRALFTLAKEKKDGHRQPFAGDPGAAPFSDVLSAPAEPSDAGTRPDDLAVLQYTGGTTGISKGAMLSHRTLVANTLQCRS